MNDSFTYTTDTRRKDSAPPTAGKTFSRLGLSLALLVVGMAVGQEVISWLLVRYVSDVYDAWWPNWVVSVVPLYGVGLPLMCLALRGLSPAPHNPLCNNGFITYEKPRFTAKNWTAVLFMGFGCMYIGSIVGNFFMNWLTALTGYPYANGLDSMVKESPLWATLLATCVIAPLGEEFIFRKLFIDRARRYGDTVAIVLSGVLFGLFHGNLFQFFYAAALGILLAYVYTRTGDFWRCALMHAIVNLVGGVIVPALAALVPTGGVGEEISVSLWQGLLSIGLSLWIYGVMITAVVLFIKRRKWRVLSPSPDLRPTRAVFRDAWGSPGMLVALILLVMMVIASLVLPVWAFYMTQTAPSTAV